jgi:hypothetical protein
MEDKTIERAEAKRSETDSKDSQNDPSVPLQDKDGVETPNGVGKPQHQKRHWHDHAAVWAAIAAALAAVAAAAAGTFQGVVADKALAIAREANVVAKDTERRQLRAYAYISPTLPTLQKGKPVDLEFTIKALGPTLAYDVLTTINVGESGDGLQSNEYYAAHPLTDRCADFATILDPSVKDGRKVHLPLTTFSVTDDTLTALKTPSSRLYILGEMRYRDTFSCQHWTRYCYQIGGTPLRAEECHDHNRNAVDDGQACETKRPPLEPALGTPACERMP